MTNNLWGGIGCNNKCLKRRNHRQARGEFLILGRLHWSAIGRVYMADLAHPHRESGRLRHCPQTRWRLSSSTVYGRSDAIGSVNCEVHGSACCIGEPTTGTAKWRCDLAVAKLRPILVSGTEKNETDPRCTLTGCYRLTVAEDSTRCDESQCGPDMFFVPVYLGTSPSLSACCLVSRGLPGPTSPIDLTVLRIPTGPVFRHGNDGYLLALRAGECCPARGSTIGLLAPSANVTVRID